MPHTVSHDERCTECTNNRIAIEALADRAVALRIERDALDDQWQRIRADIVAEATVDALRAVIATIHRDEWWEPHRRRLLDQLLAEAVDRRRVYVLTYVTSQGTRRKQGPRTLIERMSTLAAMLASQGTAWDIKVTGEDGEDATHTFPEIAAISAEEVPA